MEEYMEIRYQVGEAWKGEYNPITSYGLANVVKDSTGLSIYRSLKSGNVGHPLSDMTWWFCIIDMSSIENEADRIQALNDAIARDELTRVSGEELRFENERGRVSAEEVRVAAEQDRESAEQSRVSAELLRDTAEQGRKSAEESRESAEESRESAEESRESAEQDRQESESSRVSAESRRQIDENNRAGAELDRISNESNRVSGEASRVSAEQERVSSEQSRVSAEQLRVVAEQNRHSAFTDAQGQRTSAFNASQEQRAVAFNTSQGERATSYQEAEQARDTAYTAAEEQRDGEYEDAEGDMGTSTPSDGSRWGEFKRAEQVRDRIIDVMLGTSQWAGCRWRKDSATTEGEPCGSIAKLERLAEIIGLGGYLVQNDHSRRKLSAANHNFFANGDAASLAGDMGHYQWGWSETLYYAHWEDDDYLYEAIDVKPIPGKRNYIIPPGSRSCAGYATIDRVNGNLVSFVSSDPQYRGGNNNAALDELFNSQLCKPATQKSISAFATAARKNGNMWFANSRVMLFMTAAIKRIIFHNRNIQAAVNNTLTIEGLRQGGTGNGVGSVTSWANDWSYYPYIPLSAGVGLGDMVGVFSVEIDDNGTVKNIGGIPSFYGLKNDYKYLGCMEEDVLLLNTEKKQGVYISHEIDGSVFDLSSVVGKTLAGQTPVATSAGWSYISKLNLEGLVMFPLEVGASGTTGYADGYYNPAADSVLRGAFCLGDANGGDHAGSAFLYGYYAPSNAIAFLAACLCEFARPFSTMPTLFA